MLVVIFTCLQGCIQSVLDVINVSTLRVSISNAVLVVIQVCALHRYVRMCAHVIHTNTHTHRCTHMYTHMYTHTYAHL